ncbi:MAG TPA: AAA family ATPase [Anaerolineaceae bacterium]|nr:AAA family ATPase [Anaerolineaceae bacterium]
MTATSAQSTILLVSKNEVILADTRTTLRQEDDFYLIDKKVEPSNLLQTIAETQPDILLLEYGFQPQGFFELVDRIATDYPMCAVVVILPEQEMVNSERVILSGARAFLIYPYKTDHLVNTIKRVLELMERSQTFPMPTAVQDSVTKPRNTFTVFSPKGGAGSTTVAVNLAISLQKQLKEDVLIIDGKHLFGHVSLCLNLRTGNSITDLITHAGTLDQRMIKQVVVRHVSGVYVLPSPTSITEAQGIRPEDLCKVVLALQQVFPNIIVDGGNHLNENTVTYMDLSEKILLVLNPDLASLRDVRQFMEVTKTLSYPPEKTLLILNLIGRKADVKREEIESILNMRIFGRIPADENLALSCLNEGIPIILKNPRHPISKAYEEITSGLVTLIKDMNAEYLAAMKSESTEILKKSSKLG